MTMKHRIPCFDSEIIIKVSEDDELAYHVNIQSAKNPLGFGNTLGSYETEEQAVQMAGQFCQFYTMARENGYYLKSDSFIKDEEVDIPVSSVLAGNQTIEQLRLLIKQ